jgi:DNA-binding winged helix-turn-helix (wHTH) protein
MTHPAVPLRFGRFELQPHERHLLKDGVAVALGGRAFDVLLALAERPGRLVGKRALMELVWPGLVVQDNNLAAQVSALRKAIGDDLVATIPGRGYRFTGQIESAAPEPPAPRATATTAFRTNLPSELPALLGRDDDLSALGGLVDRYRLVSIVGAGGIGKSLLAQHLLLRRRGAYPQGVCWVELGAVADAAALPGAVAAALGLEGGHGDALSALLKALTPLSLLLALDNAEHLLAGVATLARALHDAAPALRIVVTSQAPLKARAERVLRLAPLTTPAANLPLAQARAFGALVLFADRAHAVDRSFALTDANLPAVSALCRALDGLPLAIELAAARVPTLGVPKLLASLCERLQLLTANRDRAAPQRQQTLRAACSGGWGCSPAARRWHPSSMSSAMPIAMDLTASPSLTRSMRWSIARL